LQIARFALWREVRPTAYPRNVTVEKDGGDLVVRVPKPSTAHGDDRRVDAGRRMRLRLPVIQVPVRKRISRLGKSSKSPASGLAGRGLNKTHITDGKPATLWAAKEEARRRLGGQWTSTECEVGAAMLSDAPYGGHRHLIWRRRSAGSGKRWLRGAPLHQIEFGIPAHQARCFRLNIRKASDTPALAEFRLFG